MISHFIICNSKSPGSGDGCHASLHLNVAFSFAAVDSLCKEKAVSMLFP